MYTEAFLAFLPVLRLCKTVKPSHQPGKKKQKQNLEK
jgi:hypothetical protein